MPQLSIHLAAWNSLTNLPALFESLENQTFKDFVVRVVDNGSNDGLEKWLREKYPQVMLIRNSRNLGFEVAHNQLIKYAISKWGEEDLNHHYVVIINPDVILATNCLEKLVAEAESFIEAGSFAPKVLKMFQDNFSDEVLKDNVRSDVIDNTGLRADRYRRFHKRGSGELDQGQYDASKEIFGTNNIFSFYRAAALEKIKMNNGEYFDEDFFDYKEDADLAWRLQGNGSLARFVPEAVAYHTRGTYGKDRVNFFSGLNKRREKSQSKSFFALRNHWWVLIKNMSLPDWLLAAPFIFPSEIFRWLFACLLGPSTIWVIFRTVYGLPKMLKKRREILTRRQVVRSKISRWFR